MANNEYINKVEYGDQTLIDISDTTAEAGDVLVGQTFYTKSGAPATGTLGDATTTTHGLMSATDKNKLDSISANAAVSDVQIDNTSILSSGVANIPTATSDTFGVIKVGTGLYTNSSGKLYTNGATSYQAKAGTSSYVPIVPSVQHESVFYGLAKAAGDSTQSASSNSVGTYTANAQASIQSMLAVAPTASPIFTGSISLGRAANTTVGTNSFAVGDSCEASAEEAHAEGRYTTASGYYSHAEGNYTFATGQAAHAEGTVTIANHASQHTFGEYNVPDSSVADAWSRGNYVEIVGNGTASNAQSNARALDWSGNEYLKGDLYVGCDADSDNGTKVATIAQLPSTMTGATSSVAGSGGLVPAPATTDVDKFLAGDGTYKSGGLPMVILSYGNSTWSEFENAYNNNVIVYCRASSNSNPATGSQTRMAFMAYVNNATTPTEVEFQYYRSMSAHSATAMGDQVFVYKLTKTGGWSVTTRDASIKEINVASGSKLGVSWSSNKVTLSNTMTADDMPMSSSDATTTKNAIDTLNGKILPIVFGANTKNLTQNLQDGWVNNVPNDNAPHFVRIISQYGDFVGYLNRYSNVYGSGVLTRYTGEIANVSLDNGTASICQLNNKVSSVVITERAVAVTFTGTLNAHSGASLTSLGGSALSPNVPSGYTFVGNVNIVVNGLIGVSASFDGTNQHTSTSVNPYLFNASNGTFSSGAICNVRLFSLCIKN